MYAYSKFEVAENEFSNNSTLTQICCGSPQCCWVWRRKNRATECV